MPAVSYLMLLLSNHPNVDTMNLQVRSTHNLRLIAPPPLVNGNHNGQPRRKMGRCIQKVPSLAESFHDQLVSVLMNQQPPASAQFDNVAVFLLIVVQIPNRLL